jgi:hypothetical protein
MKEHGFTCVRFYGGIGSRPVQSQTVDYLFIEYAAIDLVIVHYLVLRYGVLISVPDRYLESIRYYSRKQPFDEATHRFTTSAAAGVSHCGARARSTIRLLLEPDVHIPIPRHWSLPT